MNIVDVGFTAGLFAKLYELTGEEKYKSFLKKFVDVYIKLFYKPEKQGFATSLDAHDHQTGGMFGRGQAWALEGLIPAYRVLKEEHIRDVIASVISTLLQKQTKGGAWAYNLSRPFMGIDCKATPVIALALLEWNNLFHDQRLTDAARKAIRWCEAHTANSGREKGGIFSYSVEGAIVHSFYTNTAFVYANAYALEVLEALR